MNWQDRERDMQEELKALEAIAGRKDLGNLTLAAENARAVWRWRWLDGLIADLRYALRVLVRQPSFTAVAVLSLGPWNRRQCRDFQPDGYAALASVAGAAAGTPGDFRLLQLLLDLPTISSNRRSRPSLTDLAMPLSPLP